MPTMDDPRWEKRNQTTLKPGSYTVKQGEDWSSLVKKLYPKTNPEDLQALKTVLAKANKKITAPRAGTVIKVPANLWPGKKPKLQTPAQPVPTPGYTGPANFQAQSDPNRPWAQPAGSIPASAYTSLAANPVLPRPPGSTNPLLNPQTPLWQQPAGGQAGPVVDRDGLIKMVQGVKVNTQSMDDYNKRRAGQQLYGRPGGKETAGEVVNEVERSKNTLVPGKMVWKDGKYVALPSTETVDTVPRFYTGAANKLAAGDIASRPLIVYGWDVENLNLTPELMKEMGYYYSEVTGNWIRLSPTALAEQSAGQTEGWSGGGGLANSYSSGWGGGGGGGYNPYPEYTGYNNQRYNNQRYPVSDSGRMLRATTLGTISWRI